MGSASIMLVYIAEFMEPPGKLSGCAVALCERGPTAAEKRLKQLAELLDRLDCRTTERGPHAKL